MSVLWIASETVAELTGWTPRHTRRLVASGEITARDSARLGRNGKPAKEYSLASLPAEARAQYLDGRERASSTEEQFAVAKPECVPCEPSPLSLAPARLTAGEDTAPEPSVQSTLRVDLTPAAEKEAIRRLSILKPLLDYLRDPKSQPQYSNSNAVVAAIAKQHEISERTLWRWKTQFDREGRFALARKPRADKNRSQWATNNPRLLELAALVRMGNGEQPAQSVRVAWEEVCRRAELLKIAAPSYETVRAALRQVSPSMMTYGIKGRRAYEAQFSLFHTRGYTEPANSIWMADHFICDVIVQNDILGARDRKHLRLHATVIFDYRSRMVLAVVFSVYGSSHSIKRALLMAIRRFGLPDRFYCDNGKDFISVAKGASERELRRKMRQTWLAEAEDLESGFLKRLGIPVTFCEIYHGQSKGEERFHRTWHDRFDRTWPTYTAGETHLRPENTIAATAQHGKLLRMGRPQDSQLPLASYYIQAGLAWVDQWYHQRPHSGRGMDGRTPEQVMQQERGTNRPCPEDAVLAMLLAERATRKVMNCQIEIAGDYFVPEPSDEHAHFRMHELSGSRVTIAYDPLEPMFAAVLDEDGNFVCKLQRKNLMRFSNDQETRDQVKGLIARRNGMRKAVTNCIADLNRSVIADGYTTLVQQNEDRLQLPHAVGEFVVQPAHRPAEDSGFKETHSADIARRLFRSMEAANGTL
jgi:transposase-like protein